MRTVRPIVLAELRRGNWLLLDHHFGFDDADLRAAFRILKRGTFKGLVTQVRLMEAIGDSNPE